MFVRKPWQAEGKIKQKPISIPAPEAKAVQEVEGSLSSAEPCGTITGSADGNDYWYGEDNDEKEEPEQ